MNKCVVVDDYQIIELIRLQEALKKLNGLPVQDEAKIKKLHDLIEAIKETYLEQTIGLGKPVPFRLQTEEQACLYLKCSKSKIQNLRKNGCIEYIKIGNRVHYSYKALDQFLNNNTFRSNGF